MKSLFPILGMCFALSGCSHDDTLVTTTTCYIRLRQLDLAQKIWAEEHGKTTNDAPTWEDLREYLKTVPMTCPKGTAYTLSRVGELPTCSISAHTAYWKKQMQGR